MSQGASNTGGVPSFSIQGRLYRERERLAFGGMTDEERSWRKQWIADQKLADNEPVHVPELYAFRNNVFKRVCRMPLDRLFKPLEKTMGPSKCSILRYLVGKCLIGISLIYSTAYYFKYNQNTWTTKGGWRVVENRPAYLPGETFVTKVKYNPLQEQIYEKEIQDMIEDDLTMDIDPLIPSQKNDEDNSKNKKCKIFDTIIEDNIKANFEDKIIPQKPPETKDKGPAYRSLGSYYASRGFENSPI